jgi:hypothetical protein
MSLFARRRVFISFPPLFFAARALAVPLDRCLLFSESL